MNGEASSTKMVFVMTLIAAICGTLIVSAYLFTAERIQKNKNLRLQEAASAVLPCAVKMQTQIDSTSGFRFFEGFDSNGKVCGYALEAEGKGFSDIIRTLFAYDPSKKQIVGFKVVESKETPGIGDKILTDTSFLANFRGLDISQPIVAVKHGKKTQAWQIDGITGATISSKAVAKLLQAAVKERIPAIQKHAEVSNVP